MHKKVVKIKPQNNFLGIPRKEFLLIREGRQGFLESAIKLLLPSDIPVCFRRIYWKNNSGILISSFKLKISVPIYKNNI